MKGATSRPVNISIVAHALRAGGGVSVGKNSIKALMEAMPDARYQVFVPDGIGYETIIPSGVKVEIHHYEARSGKLGRFWFDESVLPALLKSFSPNVILCLGNVGVRFDAAPQIILVQDSHYFYPSRHYAQASALEMLMYRIQRARLARDLKRAKVVLCQTQSAMKRLKNWYGFGGAIRLLPNAISLDTLAGAHNHPGENRLAGDFRLFYLTRYYPHKNIELFINLFESCADKLPGVVVYLTICKSHGRKAAQFLKDVERLGLEERIINLGPVPQQQIAGLFREMHAMVMPSTLESFSGTYLEAMAFGCPVLTSDLDFAHEVCGDAAVYFDPWNVDSLAASIQKLRSDPVLVSKLVENGHRVVEKNVVSWKQNALTLTSIVEEVVSF